MHNFVWSFIGGILLGISAVGYLYTNGLIAGISGLVSQVLNLKGIINTSALWFLLGLFIVPFIYAAFVQPQIYIKVTPFMLIIAGVLVGFGTRLGSGCTSGHGICGISRLSKRSIIATMSFMFAGFIAVYVVRHMLGAI